MKRVPTHSEGRYLLVLSFVTFKPQWVHQPSLRDLCVRVFGVLYLCSWVQEHLIPGTYLHVLSLAPWAFSLRLLPKLPSDHTCSFGKQLTFSKGLDKLQEMPDRIGLTTLDNLTIEECGKFNRDISGRAEGR